MISKPCKKCLQVLPLSEFYVHKAMGDGHLSFCKPCVKARVAEHRQANLVRVQAYDRQRGYLEHRKKKVKDNYRQRISTPEGRAKEWAAKKANQDRRKRLAHIKVGHAIRDGILTPQPCTRCGAPDNIHGHHEDYSKPLDVVWLCQACHGIRHREINEENRTKWNGF